MSEANAGRVYGFYKESYDNDVAIDTLMTGDGKALFTDLSFDDGTASIGISYGQGGGVGVKVNHEDGALPSDVGVKWQVKFESKASVDAMIETLNRVKEKIVE